MKHSEIVHKKRRLLEVPALHAGIQHAAIGHLGASDLWTIGPSIASGNLTYGKSPSIVGQSM